MDPNAFFWFWWGKITDYDKRIVSKNNQTTGVIIDLTQTNVVSSQLNNILQRAGAANIKNIIIMPK